MRPTPDLPARGLMHRHPHYATALSRLGQEVQPLPCGALAVRRRLGPLRLSWLPRPAVLPDLREGPDRAALRGITLVTASDAAQDRALSGSGAIPVLTPQSRAVLPLLPDPDRQLAAQHQKWRNRLRHGQGAGLTIRHAPLPDDPGHWLLAEEAAQRRRRGYRGLPCAFALAWPETRLFLACRGQRPVAAMLLLLHPPGASYHVGWSNAEGRAASAHNLLTWAAGRWLVRRGITGIDLGPVDTDRAPGLAWFKLGTGAVLEETGHGWLFSRFLAPLGRLVG